MLRQSVKRQKSAREIVLTDCSSGDFCSVGAAVPVYPEGFWYAQVRAEDAPEIVENHLLGGEIVERPALKKVN